MNPTLAHLALEITGRKVTFLPVGETGWCQDEGLIIVPEGDDEGLLHEILHWIVASDAERLWPNLALDRYDLVINEELPEEERLPGINSEARERQACHLGRKILGMRGLEVPPWSSCKHYTTIYPEEEIEADSRIAQAGENLLQRLAEALRVSTKNPALPWGQDDL